MSESKIPRPQSTPNRNSKWATLGPGVLLAGSAVGTSHIVQSTRAGADYGLGFLVVFILISLVKYPATRFGKDYANATGKSLIHNYASYGWPVILLYGSVILLTMSFVTAGLGLVSASILNAILPFDIDGRYLTVGLLALSAYLLILGKYSFLEKLNKLLVPAFTVLIFLVTIIVALKTDWSVINWSFPDIDKPNTIYMVAIAGWLLAPMDVSVFLSLWTLEKSKNQEGSSASGSFDFNLGYWMSLVLALCFLFMGASLLSGSEVTLPQQGGAFISEIISLFSGAIGAWSYPFIAFIALTVMYSTLLTVMDGYARNIEILMSFSPARRVKRPFQIGVVAVAVSGSLILLVFMSSFTSFIDLVGTLVFVLAPIFAILNHKAVFGRDIAFKQQPPLPMKFGSWVGILVMSIVAISYLYLKLLS